MMELYYKQESQYLSIIRECFGTDQELLDKWHVCAPADLETCVRKTYADVTNAPSFKFFAIYCTCEDMEEIVGFYGTEFTDGLRFMTSFFIKPKYRSAEVMKFFWSAVKREVGADFYTAIYASNARAQKFLEKNKFELVQITELQDNKKALLYQSN